MAAAVLNIPRAIPQTPSEESGLPVAPTGPRELPRIIGLPVTNAVPIFALPWSRYVRLMRFPNAKSTGQGLCTVSSYGVTFVTDMGG